MSPTQAQATPRKMVPVQFANIALGAAAIAFSVLADWLTSGEPGFGRMQQIALAGGAGLIGVGFLSSAWNLRVLLLLIMSAFSLTIGEVTLRAFVGPYFSTVYQLDSRYIYKLLPNATKIYKRASTEGGEPVVVHVNERGFRESRTPAATPAGAKRVVVYGDSFIEGEYSNVEQTFVERLETRLNERLGKPVDALNAGVSGYGPDQAFARITDELPALRPDLLVMSIYAGNDFGDLIRNKMFRVDPDGSLVRNPWQLAPHLKASFARASSGFLLSKIVEKRFHGLMETMDENPNEKDGALPWLEYQQRDYEDFVRRGNNVVSNLSNDYLDIDVSVKPDADAVRYKIALMRGVLAGIKQAAARTSTPLVLLIIPAADDVCQKCEGTRLETVSHPGYTRGRTATIVEELARDLSIPAVNLLLPFLSSTPDDLYFRKDTHWNDGGQDEAATVVSRYIAGLKIMH